MGYILAVSRDTAQVLTLLGKVEETNVGVIDLPVGENPARPFN